MAEHIPEFTQRQRDRIDQATGLERFPNALADMPALMRQNDPDRILGIIAMSVVPNTRLLRQSPDAIHRMRVEASRHVRSLLRPQDKVYAISQREWLLILPDLVSASALMLAMIRLRDGLTTLASQVSALAHLPQLALGSAMWPQDGNDPLHLLQSARIARLCAEQGSPNIQMYDPSMESGGDDEEALLAEFSHALRDNDGIALYLQPQIDIASGRCVSAEGLLRWQRKSEEWVPPPRILEAIDQLGLRQGFNRWLMQQAAQLQRMLKEQGVDIVLSINLSANDLLDAELPDMIAQSLATWEIDPARMLLEITETMMVEESWQVMDVLKRLRGLGLKLSIDDFGTGYAGMSYLQRLPVQEVKIDQMFVREVTTSDTAREIITSVIQLARRLKMSVIAEGVETEAVRDMLASLGCARAQGFLYARALPATEFIAWWHANQAANPTGPSS